MDFARAFRSDPLRHEGVRPIQIWGLRLFYLLMLVFVTPSAWRVLLTHEGAWQPLSAVAWSVWASYPALAVFGLLQPLRWLPILFFAIAYKSIWLAFVAYPLWRAGTLEGSSAQAIAESFLALPLLALVIPWGYAWRSYVVGTHANALRTPAWGAKLLPPAGEACQPLGRYESISRTAGRSIASSAAAIKAAPPAAAKPATPRA